MAEGVERPPDRDLDAERIAEELLAVLDLAHEGLAAGQVAIVHHVRAADHLEQAFGDEPAEIGDGFGIAFEERLDVGRLVENEPVGRLLLENLQRHQNVRQPHLQELLARLEHGAFPMRVGNKPEGWFSRHQIKASRCIRPPLVRPAAPARCRRAMNFVAGPEDQMRREKVDAFFGTVNQRRLGVILKVFSLIRYVCFSEQKVYKAYLYVFLETGSKKRIFSDSFFTCLLLMHYPFILRIVLVWYIKFGRLRICQVFRIIILTGS